MMNPFPPLGLIVEDDHFYGRQYELRCIEYRVYPESGVGSNLSIIGEARIGKTSLAHRALIKPKSDLHTRKIIPILINLGTFEAAKDFFSCLVQTAYREIVSLELSKPAIEDAKKDFDAVQNTAWENQKEKLKEFFRWVRRSGIHMIFILDEFDAARSLFLRDIASFQLVRDLSYNPDWRINWVIISRRTIREIEEKSFAISNLEETCGDPLYIKTFRPTELDPYFERFAKINLSVTPEDRAKLIEVTGCHPFLLDIVGSKWCERIYLGETPDLESAIQAASPTMRNHYSRILANLQDDGSLEKLCQILFGPVYDELESYRSEFLNYGLIHPDGDGYSAFSPHFEDYIRIRYRSIPIWPLWSQLEPMLRDLIHTFLTQTFGTQWINPFRAKYPKRAGIDKALDKLKRSQQAHPNQYAQDLLEYIYPMDLLQIMEIDRPWFQKILTGDWKVWQSAFQVLSKVRNPLAHNSTERVLDSDRDLATGYCKQLIDLISAWKAKQKP